MIGKSNPDKTEIDDVLLVELGEYTFGPRTKKQEKFARRCVQDIGNQPRPNKGASLDTLLCQAPIVTWQSGDCSGGLVISLMKLKCTCMSFAY
jgi:hypothetical protein